MKEIKISGIKTITDSLISIYNEYGVKAVANFNKNGDYVYELTIPLSLLALTAKNEFAYQLKINGLSNMNFGRSNSRNNGFRAGGNFGSGRGNNEGNNSQDLISATDFWGKYVLITQ